MLEVYSISLSPRNLPSIEMKFSAALIVLSSLVLASSAITAPDVKADVLAVVDKIVTLDKATTALPTKGASNDQFLVCTTCLFHAHCS